MRDLFRAFVTSRDPRPAIRSVVVFAAGMFGGGAFVAWLLRDKEQP